MNNKKCRGSLAIKPGRTVMRGFWPLDLDLRASNRSARDLIVAVHPISGGQGGSGAWGRQRSTPAALFCGGAGWARRSSPYTAFRGLNCCGEGPGSTNAARVIHWDPERGPGMAGLGQTAVRRFGGTWHRRRWRSRGSQGLQLAPRGPEQVREAHRAVY